MSTVSTQSQTVGVQTAQAPDDERLHRLAVEAGKYLGLSVGEPLPTGELFAQGDANGYEESDIRDWLEVEGLDGRSEIPVPPQGDILGKLWRVEDSANQITRDSGKTQADSTTDSSDPHWQDRPNTHANGAEPEPLDNGVEDCYGLHKPIARQSDEVARDRYCDDDGEPLTHFEAVGQYLKRRATDTTCQVSKGWANGRRGTALNQYGNGLAMDRYLLDIFKDPTLTILSLRIRPSTQSRLTLLEELAGGVDAALYKLRRRLQKDADAPLSADEWHYQLVFAGTDERGTPHCHIIVYTEGDIERARFANVVDWFVEKCAYAETSGNSPKPDSEGMAQAVSIRGNSDDTIPRVDGDSCEVDNVTISNSQAAVYCQSQLPHLKKVEDMARDELLHSTTLDGSSRSAFRKSMPTDSIPDRYFATGTSNLDDAETSRTSAESDASESPEGKGSSEENPPAGSRFTFTDGRESGEEGRFSFTGHG